MTCSQGYKTVVYAAETTPAALPATPTWSATDHIQDIVSEAMTIDDSFLGGEQIIRGRRDRIAQTVTLANVSVSGGLSMLLNHKRLGQWLSLILGAASSPYVPTDTMKELAVKVKRATAIRDYLGCYINSATISGSEGGPITLDIDLVGKTFTHSASDPGLINDYSGASSGTSTWVPFMFSDCTFQVNAVATGIQSFTLALNNFLDPTTLNSLLTTDICTQDFSCTFSVTSKAGDLYSGLYDTTSFSLNNGKGKPETPAAVILTLNHVSGGSAVFTMPQWIYSRSEGTTGGRGTLTTTFSGECYADVDGTPAYPVSIAVT